MGGSVALYFRCGQEDKGKGRTFQKVESGPQRTTEKEVRPSSLWRVDLFNRGTFRTPKMEGLNNICLPKFQNYHGAVTAMYHGGVFFPPKCEYFSSYAMPVSSLYIGSMQ